MDTENLAHDWVHARAGTGHIVLVESLDSIIDSLEETVVNLVSFTVCGGSCDVVARVAMEFVYLVHRVIKCEE